MPLRVPFDPNDGTVWLAQVVPPLVVARMSGLPELFTPTA
jgi:hypothetical protein